MVRKRCVPLLLRSEFVDVMSEVLYPTHHAAGGRERERERTRRGKEKRGQLICDNINPVASVISHVHSFPLVNCPSQRPVGDEVVGENHQLS
jgi:hypothetical protein